MITRDQRKTLKKFWDAEKVRVVGDGEIHYLKDGIWWFGAREVDATPPGDKAADEECPERPAA